MLVVSGGQLVVFGLHLIAQHNVVLLRVFVQVVVVMLDRAALVLEHRVVVLRKVQDVLGKGQDGDDVGEIHGSVSDVNWQNLRVSVSGDVSLNRHGQVAEIEETAVLVGVEEGQVDAFFGAAEEERGDDVMVSTFVLYYGVWV